MLQVTHSQFILQNINLSLFLLSHFHPISSVAFFSIFFPLSGNISTIHSITTPRNPSRNLDFYLSPAPTPKPLHSQYIPAKKTLQSTQFPPPPFYSVFSFFLFSVVLEVFSTVFSKNQLFVSWFSLLLFCFRLLYFCPL